MEGYARFFIDSEADSATLIERGSGQQLKKYLLYVIVGLAISGIAYKSYDAYKAQQIKEFTQATQQAQGGLEIGMKAPNLELEQDGKMVELSDLTNRLIVINFWATWCPPCKQEIPELNAFAKAVDVPVYGINVTTSERKVSDVADFLKETPVDYGVLYDTKGQSENAYRLVAMPATYVIDTDGVIVAKHIGPVTSSMLKEMVGKKGG